jgi:hypothetical protein
MVLVLCNYIYWEVRRFSRQQGVAVHISRIILTCQRHPPQFIPKIALKKFRRFTKAISVISVTSLAVTLMHCRCECTVDANALHMRMHCRCECTADANALQMPIYCRCECTVDANARQMRMHCRCECTADANVLQMRMYCRCECTADPNAL